MLTEESESVRCYNIKCHVSAKELLKITLKSSRVCCRSGNISETVQDSDVVTTAY